MDKKSVFTYFSFVLLIWQIFQTRFTMTLHKNKVINLKMEEKNLELPSNWDQFCDFTSLVGFRLLHSNNSRWLRYFDYFLK